MARLVWIAAAFAAGLGSGLVGTAWAQSVPGVSAAEIGLYQVLATLGPPGALAIGGLALRSLSATLERRLEAGVLIRHEIALSEPDRLRLEQLVRELVDERRGGTRRTG